MKILILKNRFLVAKFSPADGGLLHLSADGRGPGRVSRMVLRYLDLDAQRWYSNEPAGDRERIVPVSVAATGTSLTAVHRTPHVEIALRYELAAGSPLLKASLRAQGLGAPVKLGHAALPGLRFGPGFNDPFEDERDLYSDGAELGGGRELPCWRVFFRKGYRAGLMLATRCKRDMARFNVLADGVDLEPHGFSNYTSVPVGNRPPLTAAAGVVHEARFEIGPWAPATHGRLLRRAGLLAPVVVGSPPPAGRPKAIRKGRVFYAVDFAAQSAVRAVYARRRWRVATLPCAQKGRALVAGSGVRPPALSLRPGLRGLHRVFVGIGSGDGIAVRFSGEPEYRVRMAPIENGLLERPAAFTLHLSGRHAPREVCCGTVAMDGRRLRIERFPNTAGTTILDYVRFEPLSASAVRRWEAEERRRPSIELSGFNDVPDIAHITDADAPDAAAYRANIWEHARCGFKRIYWRIDGQCSDYPSKVNTMRYPSAKVHGVFCPHAKAYGRVLRKTDLLRLAVESAGAYGVELYGWMRFNNYSGNVQSEFFRRNPSLREETEGGAPASKLCLAIPEVRRHKIDILVEAAGYGLQGLNLGFLRHPPILLYHPVLVDGFREKTGMPPPRERKRSDPNCIQCLPPADEMHEQWYRYRAGFMTLFGRELRAALRARGLGHVKISLWLRPNHCLFDGIDLPAWLAQGLCDEVVLNGVIGPDLCCSDRYDSRVCGVRPEWKTMVRRCVPLIRCLAYRKISRWRPALKQIQAEGYDGLCTYESGWSVLDTDFIDSYRSLRSGKAADPAGLAARLPPCPSPGAA